jgi:hypothetical protein
MRREKAGETPALQKASISQLSASISVSQASRFAGNTANYTIEKCRLKQAAHFRSADTHRMGDK